MAVQQYQPALPGTEEDRRESGRDKIVGNVTKVVHVNESNGYVVFRVKAKGLGDTTVTGYSDDVTEGMRLECRGSWTRHPRFGRQFAADMILKPEPDTIEGIRAFLCSDLVKGIGPTLSERLIRTFGMKLQTVIDKEPERLAAVPGMTKNRIDMLKASWEHNLENRRTMIQLMKYGITSGQALKIWREFGRYSLSTVTKHPYKLMRIEGIGFRIADSIGLKAGLGRTSPERLQAGLEATLQQAMADGHCCLPARLLVSRAAKNLEVDKSLLTDSFCESLQSTTMIREKVGQSTMVYLTQVRAAEISVSDNLKRLCETPPAFGAIESAVAESEKRLGIELAPEQREAVGNALRNRVSIITGGPGVGKTLTVRVILDVLRHGEDTDKSADILMCAPTGRAAKRLTETSGEEAKTIHRLLGYQNDNWKYGPENPLPCSTLIVDECSMLDVFLARHLVEAIPSHARVIFVGDVDQIPSVGPGAVLADMIASGIIPVTRLTRIYRQAEESQIVTAAHAINRGEVPSFPPDQPSDFMFVEVDDPEEVADLIRRLITETLPREYGFKGAKDIQVLSPMKRSSTGVTELNRILQQALNPVPEKETEVLYRADYNIHAGDKVMQTVNNYDHGIFNGDIGTVKSICRKEKKAVVEFDGGRAVQFELDDTGDLQLAYAFTVHKSQGSEFPCVIIPLTKQHYIMLQRNLFYTAVTRGKKLVIVIGQREAYELAVHKQDAMRRFSTLAWRLNRRVPSALEAAVEAAMQATAEPVPVEEPLPADLIEEALNAQM